MAVDEEVEVAMTRQQVNGTCHKEAMMEPERVTTIPPPSDRKDCYVDNGNGKVI